MGQLSTRETSGRTRPEDSRTQASPTSLADELDIQIRREWLLTNGRGGFASGTVVGVPTRRYHGLLIAAARPPLERWLLLSAVLERATVTGQAEELASFEFRGAYHPHGFMMQTDFTTRNHPQNPWVQFEFRQGAMRMAKTVVLPHGRDEVLVHYLLESSNGGEISLELAPFVAMRDFHAMTHAFDGGFPVSEEAERIAVDAYAGGPRLWLDVERLDGGPSADFDRHANWWYGFVHREETHRGQDDIEDLFVPGWFRATGVGRIELILRGSADFGRVYPSASSPVVRAGTSESAADAVNDALAMAGLPESSLDVEQRLREAAQAFLVTRRRADGREASTVLAGYHWFGDWGRDTFIAMPGLLIETGRHAEAREVLETFASAQRDGLIPNRFSDYGDGCDYNSVDASLWYMRAASQYMDATGDEDAWHGFILPACERIVASFVQGTIFKIHVDLDGLVSCGDAGTQLTWMDAKCGDVVFTPRHGKPIEINALWYDGLSMLAERLQSSDAQRADKYRTMAANVARVFAPTFWNEAQRCLFDVVRDRWRDRAIRPNQIFAVSLPHSPLNETQQRAVLSCVECELLTPYGLRSLSPQEPGYRRHYEGDGFQRDSAYHQGTVWGWLIGPYVEAYLRVHDFSEAARQRMRTRLVPLIAHLDSAGIASVSEIFDGDPPHTPCGCIAQAWSVAELYRAWRMAAPD